MNQFKSQEEFEEALSKTITHKEKQQNMLNVISLMSSAVLVGGYAGYMKGNGYDLDISAKVAVVVPTVLSGIYLSLFEPASTSDVERISDSKVEIIELGPMSKLERVLAACAGSLFAAASTASGFGAGYLTGSIIDKF